MGIQILYYFCFLPDETSLTNLEILFILNSLFGKLKILSTSC
jgi:hypothetical protein